MPTLIKSNQTGLGYSFMISQQNSSILPKEIGHALYLHPPHLVPSLACIITCFSQLTNHIHIKCSVGVGRGEENIYGKLSQLNQHAAEPGKHRAQESPA